MTFKRLCKPGMVAHTYNPSIQEIEAGIWLPRQGYPKVYRFSTAGLQISKQSLCKQENEESIKNKLG